MRVRPQDKHLTLSLYFLYLLFLASVICSWNTISSLTIGLISVVATINNKVEKRPLFTNNLFKPFAIGCLLLYILQCSALLYTENLEEGLRHIQLKSALLFVPLALYTSGDYLNYEKYQKMMRVYVLVLFGATVFCLGHSLSTYLKTRDSSIFFYHHLLLALEQHAIQFSILVFIAIVHLLEQARKGIYYFHGGVHFSAILYFTSFLLLLSSKLIIAVFILYLVYYFVSTAKKLTRSRLIIPAAVIAFTIITAILATTRNPVTERFHEIIAGKIELIQQDKFNPGIYFNGLQFRLLQWRFVTDILKEQHAWLLGLGPGDTQAALDQKYISANMYVGVPSRGDRGFLGYNTHNQFFESVLQTGILGLLAFIFICIGMIQMAIKTRKSELTSIIIVLLAYSLNESVFETQYGLMIFLFFPLFISLSQKSADHSTASGNEINPH